MIDRILKVARVVLIVAALLSIFFHIGFILEVGVDIKYNVTWFSPEALDTYFRYLNLHFVFLLILVVYLICEFARDRKNRSTRTDKKDQGTKVVGDVES